MSSVDVVIIAILIWGGYRGWKSGVIKELFSTCGFIAGLILAALFYSIFGEHFCPALGSHSQMSFVSCVLVFVAMWVMVPILLGAGVNMLTKKVKPVLENWIGSLIGVLIGVIKYYVLISFVFTAMSYVGILSESKKADSLLYYYVAALGETFYQGNTIVEESGAFKDSTVIIHFDRKDTLHVDATK